MFNTYLEWITLLFKHSRGIKYKYLKCIRYTWTLCKIADDNYHIEFLVIIPVDITVNKKSSLLMFNVLNHFYEYN